MPRNVREAIQCSWLFVQLFVRKKSNSRQEHFAKYMHNITYSIYFYSTRCHYLMYVWINLSWKQGFIAATI